MSVVTTLPNSYYSDINVTEFNRIIAVAEIQTSVATTAGDNITERSHNTQTATKSSNTYYTQFIPQCLNTATDAQLKKKPCCVYLCRYFR